VAVDGAVVDAVVAKMQELTRLGTWRSTQAQAIEHEIEQARRVHAKGELARSELDSVLKHLRKRLSLELRQPALEGGPPDFQDWETWPLDAKREWLATVVDRIVVQKSIRRSPGPGVDLARIDIHFKDGQVRNLANSKLARRGVTLADVARLANCSEGTASLVLRGKGRLSASTRERVHAAAAELGYEVGGWRNVIDPSLHSQL
jgi:hypothetical protein